MSDKPKIGVYTCYCGGNISHTVKCEQVAKLMASQPDVVVSRTNMSLCSDAGQSQIEEDIRELGVNRVVIGACAPSLHEATFRNTVIRAGLNPYLYHHIGLREQDSWVHTCDGDGATCKACRLMAAGVAKARLLDPLEPIRLEADKQALVIGGGVAGLRAALDIADQGLDVVLVEKSPFLGGRMAQLETVFPTGEDAHSLLADLIDKVVNHNRISIFTQTEVTKVSGYVGNYGIQLTQHSRGVTEENAEAMLAACQQMVADEYNYSLTERKVIYQLYEGCFPPLPAVDWEHYNGEPIQLNGKSEVLRDEIQQYELRAGAVVVATGFDPYVPRDGEYGYNHLPQVVTLPQLIRHMALHPDAKTLEWQGRKIRDVALIHCVGSREIDGVDEPHEDGQVNNYCSRVCCTATLHMIEELQENFPELNIYDLFQDIRTYGRGHENFYKSALKGGARFVRYHGEEKPQVSAAPDGESHPVLINVKDALTYNQELEIPVDLVVLATGMQPRQIDDLVRMLKVSRGTDRFLLEVHPKLRPVETAVNGVILAGTAQGPMNIQESMSAASAAAAKVVSLLGSGQVELQPFVARVDPEKCNGTGACVDACEYEDAIAVETFMEDGKQITRAVVTPANCTGCGACVAACPNRAIDVQGWTLAQYEAMVDAIAMDILDLVEAG
ncbi:MAG: CoB--CoM heterodisulfide reductase iron-sulfur subunit A family protein [Anaerolineales bacterium]